MHYKHLLITVVQSDLSHKKYAKLERHQMSDAAMWEAIRELFASYRFIAPQDGVVFIERRTNFFYSLHRVIDNYQPEVKYQGQLVLFRATDPTPPEPDPYLTGWQAVCEQPVIVHHVSGRHGNMNRLPHINLVGKFLQKYL